MAGVAKSYRLPFDYVLYEMSYTNLLMYGAVLPSYDDSKGKGKGSREHKRIKADDPQNRGAVREILNSFND